MKSRHFLHVFTCEHLKDLMILILMSDTSTDTDCTTFVTDNGDSSNVHKYFDLSDILVSSEDMVDRI